MILALLLLALAAGPDTTRTMDTIGWRPNPCYKSLPITQPHWVTAKVITGPLDSTWYKKKVYHSFRDVPKDSTKRWDVRVTYRISYLVYSQSLVATGKITDIDTSWVPVPDSEITEVR